MGELIAIICTAEVPAATLSDILSTAYAKCTDAEPSLVLLTTASPSAMKSLSYDSVTLPPVASSNSPFLNMPLDAMLDFMAKNAASTALNDGIFLIADDQTIADSTLLLVDNYTADDETLKTVRIAGDFANIEPICLSIGTRGIDEILSWVDPDGILRRYPEP
ncbi:hypothetical protein BDV59DRAFT_185632 [Aspergillus ambiguus]|uniref:uncharacterized protein n=1 Tax=Aspergillus ambiguus TaxID=176160 RepID=UPI003CCDD807